MSSSSPFPTFATPPRRPSPQTATSHQSGPITSHWNDIPPDFTYSGPSSRTPSRSNTPALGGASSSSQQQLLGISSKQNASQLSLAVNLGSRANSRSSSAVGLPRLPETSHRQRRVQEAATAAFVAEQARREPPYAGGPEEGQEEEDEARGLDLGYDAADDKETGVGQSGEGFEELLERLLRLPSSMSPAERVQVEERMRKFVPGITEEQRWDVGAIIEEIVEGRQEGPTWGREQVVRFMKDWVGRGEVARWAMVVRRVVECVQVG